MFLKFNVLIVIFIFLKYIKCECNCNMLKRTLSLFNKTYSYSTDPMYLIEYCKYNIYCKEHYYNERGKCFNLTYDANDQAISFITEFKIEFFEHYNCEGSSFEDSWDNKIVPDEFKNKISSYKTWFW